MIVSDIGLRPMKTLLMLMAAGSLWLAGTLVAPAQTNVAVAGTSSQTSGLKKSISEKPFLGTKNVLTLSGDYVNTPKEDYEMTGVWTDPLTLEEMHGMIAEIGFGEATKKGEWQLRFKRKLMTMDNSWRVEANEFSSAYLLDWHIKLSQEEIYVPCRYAAPTQCGLLAATSRTIRLHAEAANRL
jgi:hypothetical protein